MIAACQSQEVECLFLHLPMAFPIATFWEVTRAQITYNKLI
jgi:hypothetical protein